MPTFQVAHIREQGIDLIIIPLESSFGSMPVQEQQQARFEFQVRANSAGLAGTAVLVWDGGGGRIAFFAPPNLHTFFRSVTLHWVSVNINKTLSW
jgi:hypothetical protein